MSGFCWLHWPPPVILNTWLVSHCWLCFQSAVVVAHVLAEAAADKVSGTKYAYRGQDDRRGFAKKTRGPLRIVFFSLEWEEVVYHFISVADRLNKDKDSYLWLNSTASTYSAMVELCGGHRVTEMNKKWLLCGGCKDKLRYAEERSLQSEIAAREFWSRGRERWWRHQATRDSPTISVEARDMGRCVQEWLPTQAVSPAHRRTPMWWREAGHSQPITVKLIERMLLDGWLCWLACFLPLHGRSPANRMGGRIIFAVLIIGLTALISTHHGNSGTNSTDHYYFWPNRKLWNFGALTKTWKELPIKCVQILDFEYFFR